jgi:hypothetical protein
LRTLDLSLRPAQTALVSGDYGQGKTTFVKGWAQSVGKGCFWAAPSRQGAPCDFSDIARVVHSATEMERAAREYPYVVWPSPPSSAGEEAQRQAFNDFCRIANRFRDAVVVCDEIQRILKTKFLKDCPPAFQDLVELGHKPPARLAKVFVAHRQAQVPLVLGGGASRVSFRPFPGDEDSLMPFFGRENIERMTRFGIGEFAYWSQSTGPVLPCRLNVKPLHNASEETQSRPPRSEQNG